MVHRRIFQEIANLSSSPDSIHDSSREETDLGPKNENEEAPLFRLQPGYAPARAVKGRAERIHRALDCCGLCAEENPLVP